MTAEDLLQLWDETYYEPIAPGMRVGIDKLKAAVIFGRAVETAVLRRVADGLQRAHEYDAAELVRQQLTTRLAEGWEAAKTDTFKQTLREWGEKNEA